MGPSLRALRRDAVIFALLRAGEGHKDRVAHGGFLRPSSQALLGTAPRDLAVRELRTSA